MAGFQNFKTLLLIKMWFKFRKASSYKVYTIVFPKLPHLFCLFLFCVLLPLYFKQHVTMATITRCDLSAAIVFKVAHLCLVILKLKQ